MEPHQNLDEHGRVVPDKLPRVAADAIVLRPGQDGYQVMLITRLKKTFQGCYAFPGGHVDYDEDPEVSVIRELKEECNVDGNNPQLVCVRGKPGRDPRYHVIAIVYLVEVDADAEPEA